MSDMTTAGPAIARRRAGRAASAGPNLLQKLLREPKGAIGLALVAFYAALGLFGVWLAPLDPYAQDFAATLQPPSGAHWFGTDQLGRDVFSRILVGAHSSLGIGIGGVAIAFAIGVPIGIIAGYRRGWFDALVGRAVDVMLSFPDIVFALAVVAILGASTRNVIVAVGLVSVPVFIRTARAVAMSTMAEPYIEGAESLGCSPGRVVFLHILPNMAGILVTLSSLLFASTLLAASGLGFLGLGTQPPEPEWGTMLGESRSYIRSNPYLATFPGLFLAVSALAFNMLGEALRNIYDPTARHLPRSALGRHLKARRAAAAAAKASDPEAVAEARDLEVSYLVSQGLLPAVRGVDLTLRRGRTLAVVGESGSGKSTLLRAVATLLPAGVAEITGGGLSIGGQDVSTLDRKAIREIRRRHIGLVFQDAASALNPVASVGRQLCEALAQGRDLTAAELRQRAVGLLRDVQIADPESRLDMFPHQFSGGMKQRIVIAMAMAQDPEILLADEPTSALDVTIQQQILTLLRRIQQDRGMAMLLVTHDLGIVRRFADDVAVMYAGRIVETGTVAQVFARPRHPYTLALRDLAPRLRRDGATRLLPAIPGEPPMIGSLPPGCSFAPRCGLCHGRADCLTRDSASAPGRRRPGGLPSCGGAGMTLHSPAGGLLPATPAAGAMIEVQGLCRQFGTGGGWFRRREAPVRAVEDVSFGVARGTCYAIVGESGSGKSTLARCLVGLIRPSAGTVRIDGQDIGGMSAAGLRAMRRRVQLVLQDPRASLDPRMRIRRILKEALVVHGLHRDPAAQERRIAEVIAQVGLSVQHLDRFPNALSGGQRQRVAIARAIICEPEILVLDEPVSALDVSIQAQIINLLVELQQSLGLTYVMITHDLALVGHMADQVGVMYLGRFVEQGPAAQVCATPHHPYTASLLALADDHSPGGSAAAMLEGAIPSPRAVPSGCAFHTRCPLARDMAEGRVGRPGWSGATVVSAGADPAAPGLRLPRRCVEDPPLPRAQGQPDWLASCHFPPLDPLPPDAGPVRRAPQDETKRERPFHD